MKRPVIGIGTDILTSDDGARERAFSYTTYVEAVTRAGGIPLLIPPVGDAAAEVLQRVDGVVLTGGADCDPAIYGEEPHPSVVRMDERRQSSDLAIARAAAASGLPILGICLGMQMVCVARGGTLIQDLPSVDPALARHKANGPEPSRHPVEVRGGTRLAAILGAGAHEVNSTHHQAIRSPGDGLSVTATAPDGVIEAIEESSDRFQMGVQWHPEQMGGEKAGDAIFEALVEAARSWRLRREGGVAS